MKTRILSVLAMSLLFCAGMAFSPKAEKVTPGPEMRGPNKCSIPCLPPLKCVKTPYGYGCFSGGGGPGPTF